MPSERRCSISMAVLPQEEAQHTTTKACQRCHRTISTTSPADAFIAAQFTGAVNFCTECRTNEHSWVPFELPENRQAALLGAAKEAQHDDLEVDVTRRLLRMPDDADAQDEEEVVGDDSIDSDAEMNCEGAQLDDIGNPRCLRASPRPTGQLSVIIPPQRALQHPHHQHSRDLSPAASPSRFSHPPRSPVRARAYSPIPHSGLQRRTKGNKNDGYPDPLADISRLRVRSKGHKCLYPGARFEGTQKSGRNSYDVTVNIVDVDFASSYLCGYLCIKGLTEDWPELTTYFDAQIIGDRYGFVTDAWGASEKEDIVHWTRFPAFGAVKSDVKGSKMLLPNNTSRSAIFMRWKEHFLVPDHKVEDISGASFAGFYYVCIDIAPPPTSRSSQEVTTDTEGAFSSFPVPTPTYSVPTYESSLPPRRLSASTDRGSNRPTNCSQEYTATMTGFYFHQNSEPYQQLSLTHVKDRFQSSFEFR